MFFGGVISSTPFPSAQSVCARAPATKAPAPSTLIITIHAAALATPIFFRSRILIALSSLSVCQRKHTPPNAAAQRRNPPPQSNGRMTLEQRENDASLVGRNRGSPPLDVPVICAKRRTPTPI